MEKFWRVEITPNNLVPYERYRGETYGSLHSVKFLPCICHLRASEKCSNVSSVPILQKVQFLWWSILFLHAPTRRPSARISHIMHYNNMGLFCDPNIIANNKEKSFQKPVVTNHNSSQTLKLLRYHNIRTRTIASPSQLQNLIQSQNFPIITASIHCLRLTLHQKLFATHPSP